MKIRTEPNDNLIVELESIKQDINTSHGGIEQRIDNLSHCVAMIIDALIDAETEE